MPGRNDKRPKVPKVGEQTVPEKSTTSNPIATADQDMVAAVVAVCAMSRGEDASHVLLPSQKRVCALSFISPLPCSRLTHMQPNVSRGPLYVGARLVPAAWPDGAADPLAHCGLQGPWRCSLIMPQPEFCSAVRLWR